MLQIPEHSFFDTGINYAELAALYLPGDHYITTISAARQQEAILRLNEEIQDERFGFLVDIKNHCITHCNGVSRWLGYADVRFSLKQYSAIIHPAHAVIQACHAVSVFELIAEDAIELKFMHPVWITILALKHSNGKYYYCKRECFPFQLTEENRMTEYLCRFTIIKEFAGEDFCFRIGSDEGALNKAEERIWRNVNKRFEEGAGFSMQELRILKRYAYAAGATSATIAGNFKIEKGTVETYNKRILKKAESLFDERFCNAKKTAEYFKKAHLI